jgi:arylsulfatase A-like enzyme
MSRTFSHPPISLIAVVLLFPCAALQGAESAKPNVVLIVLDDQNAFAGRTDLAAESVTPNLDRFAQSGVIFSNAQCAAPVCNPSRTALLSGLRPSTTGIYDNSQDSLPADHVLTRTTSLPHYFRQHGYLIAGAGKVFGSAFGSVNKRDKWDETMDTGRKGRTEDPRPPKEKVPLNGFNSRHDFGAFPESRETMADWRMAGWAAEFLTKSHFKPFFLACGIVKPHTPWYVPKEYFDLFPANSITLPELAADENAGLPGVIQVKAKQIKQELPLVGRRKEVVAAYLAASRYADDCVGRILHGLKNGPHRDNTIVIICGDNGYQFGEKHHWSKGGLWEGSAHVPLVIAGPEITKGQVSSRPVSLIDLYPTLIALAGLPTKPDLDGVSIVPLLSNPKAAWDRPALTTKAYQTHAVRTERWRYIRYADGSEELYDLDNDALEHTNLALRTEFAKVKADLQQWLPKHDEPRNPNSPLGKDSDD